MAFLQDGLTHSGLSSQGKSGISAVLKEEAIQINVHRQQGPYTQARRASFFGSQTRELLVPSLCSIHDPSPRSMSQNFLPSSTKKDSKDCGCLSPEFSLFCG